MWLVLTCTTDYCIYALFLAGEGETLPQSLYVNGGATKTLSRCKMVIKAIIPLGDLLMLNILFTTGTIDSNPVYRTDSVFPLHLLVTPLSRTKVLTQPSKTVPSTEGANDCK